MLDLDNLYKFHRFLDKDQLTIQPNNLRDSARAILESPQWLEALRTDVPNSTLDPNSPRETPLRLIIKLFPGLAWLVFDRCIKTNLQTKTKQCGYWKEDCVTSDNEKFRIDFDFELLDDTYVMRRKKTGGEDTAVTIDEDNDYDYEGNLWLFNHVNPEAVTYTWSKTDLKRNHPLMIMVSDNRMVIS